MCAIRLARAPSVWLAHAPSGMCAPSVRHARAHPSLCAFRLTCARSLGHAFPPICMRATPLGLNAPRPTNLSRARYPGHMRDPFGNTGFCMENDMCALPWACAPSVWHARPLCLACAHSLGHVPPPFGMHKLILACAPSDWPVRAPLGMPSLRFTCAHPIGLEGPRFGPRALPWARAHSVWHVCAPFGNPKFCPETPNSLWKNPNLRLETPN